MVQTQELVVKLLVLLLTQLKLVVKLLPYQLLDQATATVKSLLPSRIQAPLDLLQVPLLAALLVKLLLL